MKTLRTLKSIVGILALVAVSAPAATALTAKVAKADSTVSVQANGPMDQQQIRDLTQGKPAPQGIDLNDATHGQVKVSPEEALKSAEYCYYEWFCNAYGYCFYRWICIP